MGDDGGRAGDIEAVVVGLGLERSQRERQASRRVHRQQRGSGVGVEADPRWWYGDVGDDHIGQQVIRRQGQEEGSREGDDCVERTGGEGIDGETQPIEQGQPVEKGQRQDRLCGGSGRSQCKPHRYQRASSHETRHFGAQQQRRVCEGNTRAKWQRAYASVTTGAVRMGS